MKDILIVDNSLVIRKVIGKLIEETELKGSTVHQAENGKEALACLENHNPSIIFLDINMPEMNGFEFLESFKEDKRFEETSVIIVSTEGDPERDKQLAEMGIAGKLVKPIKPAMFKELVQSVATS